MKQTPQKSVTEKARRAASDVANDATDAAAKKAKTEATNVRDAVAEETQKTADAAQAAADEFDSGSMQAQAIESVARQVDNLAEQIRGTDIDRMARMVADTAQRNPLIFVAGAALAGFAATRLLKARDPNAISRSDPYSDPWQPEPSRTSDPYPGDLTSRGGV